MEVGDLPSELTCHPLAYVSFLGLDVTGNPVHSAIWESFTAGRHSEKSPLTFKILEEGHVFPTAKPKKSSYEWYVPKGILKRNWLSKHLTQIPAVAVLFYDLDWDDPSWEDHQANCARKLESLRESLKGRNTKVALVLIQQSVPLPGGENQEATGKAASLCKACDLSAKSLFALPHTDHLYGYTMRMENAFFELAQAYYYNECKRIKNHRDFLIKTTHQLLFVRHQFKIAFLYELKQDVATAVRNYKQAYANLMEVRASDTNMMEVKTFAGFINYKICSLSFLTNVPLDAISQFRKHVDIFRSKTGSPELLFEHSAWMSKQFSYFGDLFDEAVKQGLTAIQTQNPGFYYQQAANLAISRKQLCWKLCQFEQKPNVDVLAGSEAMEFYGQRPWRPEIQSMEPPDPQKERDGILALQYKEATEVNHSMIIITFLSNAVAQFKKYRCPRMKRQLMVQIGEEYYNLKEYSKALTLLTHVLWDYRVEKWRVLVSNILFTALKCAFLSASVQEYISLGLEAISSWINCSLEEKALIQTNLNNIFMGEIPLPMADLDHDDLNKTNQLWRDALSSKKPLIFTVQMKAIVPFVDCKAKFTSKTFTADQKVSLNIYLRTNCPQPMKFTKLSVLFNNQIYNNKCFQPSSIEEKASAEEGSLCLFPNKIRMFTFSFVPSPVDVNNLIQITSVALQLGTEDGTCAILIWSGPGAFSGSSSWNKPASCGQVTQEETNFLRLAVETSTRIVPREQRISMEVNHQPPALLPEFYPLSVSVRSMEMSHVRNVKLSANLVVGDNKDLLKQTSFCIDKPEENKLVSQLQDVDLGALAPGDTVEKIIFMKVLSSITRNVKIKVTYEMEVEEDGQTLCWQSIKEEQMNIEVKEPFLFFTKLLDMKFHPVTLVRCDEHFLVVVEVMSCSPLPLTLEGGDLVLSDHVSANEADLASQLSGLSLNEEETASECFCIVTSTAAEAVTLGSYKLSWRRKNCKWPVVAVQTELALPKTAAVNVPLSAKLEIPAHGWVRTPLSITYIFQNRTGNVQDLYLFMESSDAFMFAGNKQLHFRIFPRNKYQLTYNLYPLLSGYVQLPKLRLQLSPNTPDVTILDHWLQEVLPTHIFIMPQGKTGNESQSG